MLHVFFEILPSDYCSHQGNAFDKCTFPRKDPKQIRKGVQKIGIVFELLVGSRVLWIKLPIHMFILHFRSICAIIFHGHLPKGLYFCQVNLNVQIQILLIEIILMQP